jgi:hypothetical protein
MENLTEEQLTDILDAFINELIEVPIENERYTAKFIQTGYRCGFVQFTELGGKGKALLDWEALVEDNVPRAFLKYNGNFIVLKANCQDFREQVARTLPVFSLE